MVKVCSLWLMLVYAFSATGASVHLHYCCGKLQEMSLADDHGSGEDKCGRCVDHDMDKEHPDCGMGQHRSLDKPAGDHCQDIQVDAQQTTGDHLPGSDKNVLKFQALELLVFTLIHTADVTADRIVGTNTANAPPDSGPTPLFIQYCNYRI